MRPVSELADLLGYGRPQRCGQVMADPGQDHQAGAVDGPICLLCALVSRGPLSASRSIHPRAASSSKG
jgi:hypothetical protein